MRAGKEDKIAPPLPSEPPSGERWKSWPWEKKREDEKEEKKNKAPMFEKKTGREIKRKK